MDSAHVPTNRLIAMFGAKAVLSTDELKMEASGKAAVFRADTSSNNFQPYQPCSGNTMSALNPTYDLYNFDTPVANPDTRYHSRHVMPICPIVGESSSAPMAFRARAYDGQGGVSPSSKFTCYKTHTWNA